MTARLRSFAAMLLFATCSNGYATFLYHSAETVDTLYDLYVHGSTWNGMGMTWQPQLANWNVQIALPNVTAMPPMGSTMSIDWELRHVTNPPGHTAANDANAGGSMLWGNDKVWGPLLATHPGSIVHQDVFMITLTYDPNNLTYDIEVTGHHPRHVPDSGRTVILLGSVLGGLALGGWWSRSRRLFYARPA